MKAFLEEELKEKVLVGSPNNNNLVATGNQVIIKLHAISLTSLDGKTRIGQSIRQILKHKNIPSPDKILGWDFAGEVVTCGEEVGEFMPGNRVMGLAHFPEIDKPYSEYMSVDADELVLIPENVDYLEAAILPLSALAAYQALFEQGQIKPRQRILINRAAGEVGYLAVQLARAKGAYVIAVARKKAHAELLDLGVNEVTESPEDFADELKDSVDLVFGTAWDQLHECSLSALKPGGKYISLSSHLYTRNLRAIIKAKKIQLIDFLVHPSQAQLQVVVDLVRQNKICLRSAKALPYRDDDPTLQVAFNQLKKKQMALIL